MRWLWDRKASMTRTRVQDRDIRSKKSLGQNYLVSEGTLEAIVRAAGVKPGDWVLEVGPGTGNLTKHLLLAGASVVAIEKDRDLAAALQKEFSGLPLEVVVGDVLREDVQGLVTTMRRNQKQQMGQQEQQQVEGQQQQAAAGRGGDNKVEEEEKEHQGVAGGQQTRPRGSASEQQTGPDPECSSSSGSSSSGGGGGGGEGGEGECVLGSRIKVVANLPFYITKDCLRAMLPLGDDVAHLAFLLQDEVAVRLSRSGPGDPDYRAMSLEARYYSRPRYGFQIDRRSFYPPPKCNGALAQFELLRPEERVQVPSERGFLRFVSAAFSQRRKMLHNSLAPQHAPADVARALEAMGLPTSVRAQELGLEQFAHMYRTLYREGSGNSTGGNTGGA